jgi:hypothetical protein
MAWLSDAEVLSTAESWGVTITDGAESGVALLIQRQVEQIIGYPLIKVGADEDHLMMPPSPARVVAIQFPEPWASVSVVRTAVTYGSTGTLLVADQDYQLISRRLADRTLVYTGIRFLSSVSTGPNSIKVTGRPGVWVEGSVPGDIKQAAKELGAAYLQAMGASTSDASDITETQTGQVKIKSGRAVSASAWNGLTARGKAASERAESILAAYRIAEVYP